MAMNKELLNNILLEVGLSHSPSQNVNTCKCGEQYFTHGNTMHEPSNDEWDEVIVSHMVDKQIESVEQMIMQGANNE